MQERRLNRVTVAPTFRQAGVLVLDGSPSMLDPVAGSEAGRMSKGAAVGAAAAGLVGRLQTSRNKANFSVAGIEFHDAVGNTWGPQPVEDIDLTRDFDPTRSGGDGTSVAAGLAAAERLLQGFFAAGRDGLPASAVVLVCSDGECATPDETRRVAARLKAEPRVKLACAYFATDGAQLGLPLLQEICSDPVQFCTTVYDADTLRRFWEASMSAAALPAGRRP